MAFTVFWPLDEVLNVNTYSWKGWLDNPEQNICVSIRWHNLPHSFFIGRDLVSTRFVLCEIDFIKLNGLISVLSNYTDLLIDFISDIHYGLNIFTFIDFKERSCIWLLTSHVHNDNRSDRTVNFVSIDENIRIS